MKTEEKKKELSWYDSIGLDFEIRHLLNNCQVSETKPVWVEYSKVGEYETYIYKGIAKFGIITDLNTNETREAISLFHGFENGLPWWEEECDEYHDLKWCDIEEVTKGHPRAKENRNGLIYYEMYGEYNFSTPDLSKRKIFSVAASILPSKMTIQDLLNVEGIAIHGVNHYDFGINGVKIF